METGPIVVFANFLSDLAVDLNEGQILAQWAQQAPRKAWLLRPGDVLVTPVPLSREFLRYVYGLTGVPPESVAVVEVPPPEPYRWLARCARPASSSTSGLSPGIEALPCCRRRWMHRRSRSPGTSASRSIRIPPLRLPRPL